VIRRSNLLVADDAHETLVRLRVASTQSAAQEVLTVNACNASAAPPRVIRAAIGCSVLPALLALSFAGCGGSDPIEESLAASATASMTGTWHPGLQVAAEIRMTRQVGRFGADNYTLELKQPCTPAANIDRRSGPYLLRDTTTIDGVDATQVDIDNHRLDSGMPRPRYDLVGQHPSNPDIAHFGLSTRSDVSGTTRANRPCGFDLSTPLLRR
jgi:hypothetical protein